MSSANEDQNRELILGSVGNDPVLRAQLAKAWDAFQAGRRLGHAGQFEQADERLEEAAGIAGDVAQTWLEQGKTTMSGNLLTFTAAIWQDQAWAKWGISTGYYEETVELLKMACKYFELAQNTEGVASSWSSLADIYAAVGDVPAAQSAMSEAMRAGGYRSE